MGADPDDVSAEEDQDVRTHLERKGWRAGFELKLRTRRHPLL